MTKQRIVVFIAAKSTSSRWPSKNYELIGRVVKAVPDYMEVWVGSDDTAMAERAENEAGRKVQLHLRENVDNDEPVAEVWRRMAVYAFLHPTDLVIAPLANTVGLTEEHYRTMHKFMAGTPGLQYSKSYDQFGVENGLFACWGEVLLNSRPIGAYTGSIIMPGIREVHYEREVHVYE